MKNVPLSTAAVEVMLWGQSQGAVESQHRWDKSGADQTQAQATISPLFYQMPKMSALKQSYII